MLYAMRDPFVLGRVEALAGELGIELHAAGEADQDSGADPAAVIIEAELPGAVDRIAAWRRRWPASLVAVCIRIPDQELWHGTLAAGADLVANRGAFVRQLETRLLARRQPSGGTAAAARLRLRLNDRTGDGLVGRLPDAPGGAIAVYRVANRLYAVRDECPHAGASLADGVLEGTIITCPRHGSQFDVTDGSRRRGPSDFPIRTYRVVVQGDETVVEVPG